jgi:hypothetical protein
VLVAKTVGASTRNSYALWHDRSSPRGIVGNACSSGTSIGFGWTPTVGRWYHLAFAFDGTTDARALYIDGVRVAAKTNTTTLGYDTHPVLIGADIDNEVVTHGFRRLADEVRIWNRGLSAIEIDLGRLNPTPSTLAGLFGRRRLSEGTGTTVLDDSGLDNHGLIGGGTIYAPSWTSGPRTPSLGAALRFDASSTTFRHLVSQDTTPSRSQASSRSRPGSASTVGTATPISLSSWITRRATTAAGS